MADFKIISDSACDLPKELIKKYDLTMVPFYVTFDDITFRKAMLDNCIDTNFPA